MAALEKLLARHCNGATLPSRAGRQNGALTELLAHAEKASREASAGGEAGPARSTENRPPLLERISPQPTVMQDEATFGGSPALAPQALWSKGQVAGDDSDHGIADRPQVLAQLAKDISDLIHSARGAAATAPLAVPAAPAPQEHVHQRHGSWEEAERGRTAVDEQLSLSAAATAMKNTEETSRASTRSPREVQVLLSGVESREAALVEKAAAMVQQLAEEKAVQQQRLEEEVRALQRSNAQMEAELDARRRADAEALTMMSRAQASKESAVSLNEATGPWREASAAQGTSSGNRSPVEEQFEQPCLQQDAREELQQQLQEIRSEVTRCAKALSDPEPMPAGEVVDIRQQLAALSSEVIQTSRALLTSGSGHSQGNSSSGSRDAELSEVRRQLEALQGQVSHAMNVALSRPGAEVVQEPALQESRGEPQSDGLAGLRAEVGSLRSELARVGFGAGVNPMGASFVNPAPSAAVRNVPASPRLQATMRPDMVDLQAQIEDLRQELGSFVGGLHTGAQSMQAPARDSRLASGRPPEVTALQERLSRLRGEVGRAVQDPRQAPEDRGQVNGRSQLGTLLEELQELRSAAVSVAAPATANGGGWHAAVAGLGTPLAATNSTAAGTGTPITAAHSTPVGTGQVAPFVREPDYWRPKVATNIYEQPAPLSRARSSTPQRYARPTDSSRFLDVGPIRASDQFLGCGPRVMGQAPVVQPMVGLPEAAGYTSRFPGSPEGNLGGSAGHAGDLGASFLTPTLGRMEPTPDLGVQASGTWGPSWRGASSGSTPPALSRVGPTSTSASSGFGTSGQRMTTQSAASLHPMPSPCRDASPARSVWNGSRTATWGAASQGTNFTAAPVMGANAGNFGATASNVGNAAPNAIATDAVSVPPEEPADIAPQGSMRRPSRSKLTRVS